MIVLSETTSWLIQLRDFLTRAMGIYFSDERLPELERYFRSASLELGFENSQDCARQLLSEPLTTNHVRTIAKHLTIGETYFFRDRLLFSFLETTLLPQLLTNRRMTNRTLRIWSAGCCSGEEPYTIAMLLADLLPDYATWNFELLGTDINTNFLGRAAEGIYGPWSFRVAPEHIKERFFTRAGDRRHALNKKIKQMVRFSYANLADDLEAYPQLSNKMMDIIFCRNVLIYFSEAQAKKTIERLASRLADGGFLILAPAEVGLAPPGLDMLKEPGVILLRKPESGQDFSSWTFNVLREAQTLPASFTESKKALRKSLVTPRETPVLTPTLIAAVEASQQKNVIKIEEERRPIPELELRQALAQHDNLPGALQLVEDLLKADKLNSTNHYLRAMFLQGLNRNSDAIEAFQNALFLDANFVMAEFGLANVLTLVGNWKRASKHYSNCARALGQLDRAQLLPESEGLTAGSLLSIISSLLQSR
jgi:chemotaxis protein methyltransferase CheR